MRRRKGRHLVATDLARSIWRLEGKCEHCHKDKSQVQLQGAHIYGVGAYPRLRDDLRNGMSLCSLCHRRFTSSPIDFTDWVRTTKYKQYLEPLQDKNRLYTKRFWDERIVELKDMKARVEEGELTLDEAREYER